MRQNTAAAQIEILDTIIRRFHSLIQCHDDFVCLFFVCVVARNILCGGLVGNGERHAAIDPVKKKMIFNDKACPRKKTKSIVVQHAVFFFVATV
jgi:hypothetical protein